MVVVVVVSGGGGGGGDLVNIIELECAQGIEGRLALGRTQQSGCKARWPHDYLQLTFRYPYDNYP